jgi:hypothetical protein
VQQKPRPNSENGLPKEETCRYLKEEGYYAEL